MTWKWRQLAVVPAASVLLAVSGVTGAATAAARSGPTVVRTNLELLAGTDPDFSALPSTRALSASPIFFVTGAPLDLSVSRTGGNIRVRQNGTVVPVHPHSILQGLPDFFRWKLVRANGTVAASALLDACPLGGNIWSLDAWAFNSPANLDPANPATRENVEFPDCGDPLTTHATWDFPSGWGTQMHIAVPDSVVPGSYTLVVTVNPDGGLRETTRSDDTIRMTVDVIDTTTSDARRQAAVRQQLTNSERLLTPPGATVRSDRTIGPVPDAGSSAELLPDLVPLPSEAIVTRHDSDSDTDFLRFSATIADLGRGPIEVDGVRAGAPAGKMLASQVIFHGNGSTTRRRAGFLFLDPEDLGGEGEWHFNDLARYQLVDSHGKVAITSGKIGFCMADVHQLDTSNPGFVAQPDEIGFGNCEGMVQLSVRERIDPGWGDEYEQTLPPQALNITGVPNGTYRIQIIADPDHQLRELTRSNNTSERTIVLGGHKGARTVTVPPIDGIDTEAAWNAIHLPF